MKKIIKALMVGLALTNIAVEGDKGEILNYKHNRKDVFVRPLK